MEVEKRIKERANKACEICSSPEDLKIHLVLPRETETIDNCILCCSTCINQIEEKTSLDTNHFRCLNDSMWNTVPAVQVTVWRLLQKLGSHDLADMMYFEPEVEKWAKDGFYDEKIIHKDANGATLEQGDSIVLIKDLNVKGANFVAKRGTAVRRISLVKDNANHIEGKINGQHIVILTQYVKKQS